ncbi:hypothetical protein DM02DRAFT_484975, partial [Periconia macrospinosa]
PCPTTPTPPSSPAIIQQATSLDTISRFHYLHRHASILVQSHGPYSVGPSGHLTCANKPKNNLSCTRFAHSLAAAQDATNVTPPDGPVLDDFNVFNMLWETTISVMERLLNLGELATEPFGWGIFGLSSGYISPDPLFSSHKQRLYAALASLQTLHSQPSSFTDQDFAITTSTGHIFTLSTANHQVHICATMLLQTMQRDWGRVRWYHEVQVVKWWLAHLGI